MPTGEKQTFDAGASLPEIPEEVAAGIAFITRYISPLLSVLGAPGRFKPVFNTRHEWLEEALLANSTTVDGSQTDSETSLEVLTGTGTRFVVGDVLQVDGSRELMTVTVVAANVLTVTRADFGTTGETIADLAVVKRMSNPALEDETARNSRSITRNRRENFTQIFKNTAGVSRTERKVKQLGFEGDELRRQIMLVKRDLMRDYAHSLINGRQQASTPEGDATTERTMDGIIQRILQGGDPATVDATGSALDESLLNQGLQAAFDRGGSPTLIAAGSVQRRALSALIEGRVRFEASDRLLGVKVDRFQSDFGTLDILPEPDIFIPGDSLLMLDPGRIRLTKLGEEGDPFEEDPLAKDGSTSEVEVIGELGLEIKNAGDGGHVLIQNLA